MTTQRPASNPPNASAGLQGNSYYMPLPSVFQGGPDCRLPALKPPKRFQPSRRPLPSVFQGVQDCRLPALKPPKRFQRSRRPPRQQLLQLHAPAICFSGGSRLPFARPQTPQTLPTLPQASKATTLTATCPQTLQTLPTLSQASQALPSVFQGFKTAVCPPSNPPNASNAPAGLQGNNSYSYMPLPSVFQGVQDCRLPALKPPKRFQRSRRPPRQQLLQLHVPAICFSGGSRLPFARPQTPQTLPTLPQASKARTLTATCPCHLFFRGFKTAVCPPSNPPNASNAPAGLQGNNSYSYMSLPSVFQGVQDCRLPALKPPNASYAPAGLQGNNSYSYMSPNPPNASNPLAGLPGPAICFSGVQDCRLPALKPPKRFQRSRRPPRQQLLQLHAPAICFSGGSRLPFARPQTPQTLRTLPQASKATTLTATCPCHLFFRGFKTAVCPPSNPPNASYAPAGLPGNNSYSYMSPNPPNASNPLAGLPGPAICFSGVQDCRLPALKPPKRFQRSRRPPRQQLLQLHAPAICFSGGSRLPFARPQTPQTLPTLPQASKATTLTATCPCHLFFRGFKTAVCSASNPPNASNPPAGLQGKNSYSYMPLPSVFQGVQDCCLPALKPPKRFEPSRRPPRQQLLQLHVPAICFSGRSRLPFARPQTVQTLPTLPQASKATTLTATCPCHLFFRGFKTAVCPPSNPPNASNAPAGLQGNNSYSYMPLPSVFQGVQDCRLPALKPPKRFLRSRRPPRQQLLQLHVPKPSKRFQPSRRPPRPCHLFFRGSRLPFARPQTPQTLPTLPQASKATTLTAEIHAPAICFSGGSRLPFARPQTPQTLPTLPQASKATTLTATCPSHLFFRGFKTAVCSASNPPNASNPPAGLQGKNSYSYMPLPSVFQGVQDCRLPALKPPKRFEPSRRPPRQQLLQLHVPAICFSGRSRLPFARTMLRQPCFKSGRCLLHLADAASPPAPCFTRTIQTHSTARACSFPRPGRKFLFVLARLAHTTHLCLFARLTNTIKCGLWPCMFCLECIFLFPGRAGHALPRLLRLNVPTNAFFAYSRRICAFPSTSRECRRRL